MSPHAQQSEQGFALACTVGLIDIVANVTTIIIIIVVVLLLLVVTAIEFTGCFLLE